MLQITDSINLFKIVMMNTGMDPEVKKYFRKIIFSFSFGLLWMLTASTAGFYFGLALIDKQVHWYNIAFYVLFLFSFAGLLFYYYKMWKG